MKRLLLLLSTLCLFAVGCQSDSTTENAVAVGDGTTLTVSLSQTRTSLGGKVGETYPVYWSEGDKIVVDGVLSEAVKIDADNRANATLSVTAGFSYPCSITYPYCASTTAEQSVVEFQAEQTYTEGSFAQGSMPMCGYMASKSNYVTLSHLACVLRFPVKAKFEGTVLEKIVVTSTEKIAGEFEIECENVTISASDNTTNAITYTLPANFALSTTAESVFHIVLPAVNVGSCTIEFIETSGEKMVATWTPNKVLTKGSVREFKTVTYEPKIKSSLQPFVVEEEELLVRYKTIFGYVKDTSGNPVKGVPVSDGFTIVTTDANGYYTMDVSNDTWYIYITLPSEYEVPINELGQAYFWKEYPSSSPRFDFTLAPLAGGKEEKFALFTYGDPQVSGEASVARFYNEAIPSIKAHYDELSKEIPCYGITLGDIISNGTSANRGHLRVPMRDGFAVQNVGMPVFHVMGNHDCNFYNQYSPAFSDERNSTYQIKVQREHEAVFGPVNYSFNRGDVHIIGMRNIYYPSNTTQSSVLGFMEEQYEWLKQDLALVPKDHTVLFCVHIPMMKSNTNYFTPQVMELLNTYPKMHIISGHRHFVWNYEYAKEGTVYTNIYEHVMGAICGAWWKTNMCGDGAPCGYGVFVGEGKDLVDWYHIGIHEGMNTRSHQMRLYRGNAVTGAAKPEGDTSETKGYYAFNFSEDTLLANIYFADSEWTIKVYEDGKYSGNMSHVAYVRRPVFTSHTGDGSLESPYMAKSPNSNDYYVTGLMLGVMGLADNTGGGRDECYHMYQYKLQNKDAEIKVEAIDRFGNVYTETKITEGTDYSITKAK